MTLKLKWWYSAQNFAHLYIWITLRSESPVYLFQKLFETWVLLWTPITPWCPILTITSKNTFLISGSSPTIVDIWQINHPKLQVMLMSHQYLIIAIVCSMVCLKNCLKNCKVSWIQLRDWSPEHREFDHITTVLQNLHWLPIESRSKFKIVLLVYICWYGLAPSYLSKRLSLKPSRGLRSDDKLVFNVPTTKLKTKTYGDRCLSIAGPNLWNQLPSHIRLSRSVGVFKWSLKTHLFKDAFNL